MAAAGSSFSNRCFGAQRKGLPPTRRMTDETEEANKTKNVVRFDSDYSMEAGMA
jgi:hypothetical protein